MGEKLTSLPVTSGRGEANDLLHYYYLFIFTVAIAAPAANLSCETVCVPSLARYLE